MATLMYDVLASSFDLSPLFAAGLVGMVFKILWVALGLGLVIFFHELGHFAVAKWCDVNVERFSIGFGPILWSFKKGETEYALSLIPFGGYVKMLGQDDMDASQMTNEEIAQDPRSYSAKTVPQRMAIISAGVIMNIITGMLFFALAFNLGVQVSPSVIAGTQPGSPAWEAGMDYGDRIDKINDREVKTFTDIMRGVALTKGPLKIAGHHRDGREFEVDIVPDGTGTKRIIGAAPTRYSLKVYEPNEDTETIYEPLTSASQIPEGQGFQPGDVIQKAAIKGETPTEFKNYPQLLNWLAQTEVRKSPVDFYVLRDGAAVETPITVAPTKFRRLGLRMDIGKIVAVADKSPAYKAGFKKGDRITSIDGKAMGSEIDPLDLPDYFYSRRPVEGEETKEVIVTVARRQEEGGDKVETLKVTPGDRAGWAFFPFRPNVPLDVPAIGLAYHMIPVVLSVDEGSPAQKAGIKEGDRITKIDFLPSSDDAEDGGGKKPVEIKFNDKESEAQQNWGYAFGLMQVMLTREMKLTVTDAQGESREVTLSPQPVENWFVPNNRGIKLEPESETQIATGFVDAIGMGITHTKNSASDIYLTLRNLFGGSISPKELHGPVGIAKVAYQIAKHGLPELLLFLGFLSVNLAVLNFLPIPVLDGGHMVFLIWEGVTRSKPSERVLWTAQALGFLFVVGLMLFVLFLDIFVHGHVN